MCEETVGARTSLTKIRADWRVLRAEVVRQYLRGQDEFWITLSERMDLNKLGSASGELGFQVTRRSTAREKTPLIGDLLGDGSRYVILPACSRSGRLRRLLEILGLYEPRGVAIVKDSLYDRKPTVFVARGAKGLDILWRYLQTPSA